MDADEKLIALKKAYADIILGISKEAAARVMASEMKSVRYQHELKVGKEEGVRMLMRLKRMMDCQTSEAEAASLNKQKKIDELEAQLHEAEDIVRDLRNELGEVQAELERLKSKKIYNLNELGNACSKEVPMENKISCYQSSKYISANESRVVSGVTVPYLSRKNECLKCYNKTVCSCHLFTGSRDLPSIIVRGKDPGLYRNGCTQRIRACERNLLDRELCLSEETDKVRGEKNGGEPEEGKNKPDAPALEAKFLSELEKKLLADINVEAFKSFSRKRKRASRQRKVLILSGGNEKGHSTENPCKIGPRLSQEKAESQSQLCSVKPSENVRNIVETDGAKTLQNDEGEKKLSFPIRGATEFSESSRSPEIDVDKIEVPSPCSESNLSNTTKGLPSQPVTLRGRVIKYTFERKRKKRCFGQSEVNGSHEMENKTGDWQIDDKQLERPKLSLKNESSRDCRQCSFEMNGSCEAEKKTGDGLNVVQKLKRPKLSSLEGSSRDQRRLAQVARQLISLSEKKWWH